MLDLTDKKELSWLAGLIRDVRNAAPAVDVLLVGAMARDLLLHHGYGVPIARATEDIDLALVMAGWAEFDQWHEALLGSDDFSAGQPAGHRLLHQSGVPIDLIPFGGVERPDGTIVWPDDESVMVVLGFREARATAIEPVLPEGQRIPTVSLPILGILKLVAWSQRHVHAPRKDSSDLFLILQNYLNKENTERLYRDAAHLLEAKDFDYDAAGAWLVGHDAAASLIEHCPQSQRVIDCVDRLLSAEIDPEGPLRLIGEVTGVEADRARQLLGAFYDGFQSKL